MHTTRRRLLTSSLVAGAASGVARPAIAQTAAPMLEDSLVIRTTGGVFEASLKRNFFDPFTKATGVRVVPVAASDSEMQAKATAMLAGGARRMGHHLAADERAAEPVAPAGRPGRLQQHPGGGQQPAGHVRAVWGAVSGGRAGAGLRHHRVPGPQAHDLGGFLGCEDLPRPPGAVQQRRAVRDHRLGVDRGWGAAGQAVPARPRPRIPQAGRDPAACGRVVADRGSEPGDVAQRRHRLVVDVVRARLRDPARRASRWPGATKTRWPISAPGRSSRTARTPRRRGRSSSSICRNRTSRPASRGRWATPRPTPRPRRC